jgi:2-polyprenyl-3-methyl-5-hydroxy-6-metoxy-1,4-benzoquinol methylase
MRTRAGWCIVNPPCIVTVDPAVSNSLRKYLKEQFLAAVSQLTHRWAVLLPHQAGADQGIFALRANYRVERELRVELEERMHGRLRVELLGYHAGFPTETLCAISDLPYTGPGLLTFDPALGRLRIGERELGSARVNGRRFCLRITLDGADGRTRSRLTGHYLTGASSVIDGDYFNRDTYEDYEAQSAGDHERVLSLLELHRARGPVLEIGCATGGLLQAMAAHGYTAVGLDVSAWAVARAAERGQRAWVGDIEGGAVPDEILGLRPFGTLMMWAVLEHLRDPVAALEMLSGWTSRGGRLFINTTNADSLSHFVFGGQWEGHFDWTHRSVDLVSVRFLREQLTRLGWRIERMETHLVWDGNADPTHATLREWYCADARFRRLIAERELGDLITCVAVKD